MKKAYVLLCVSLFFLSCLQASSQSLHNPSNRNSADSINIKIFQTQNGWGYDIYVKNKKYIHQETIPAVRGNNPFRNKEDAKNVAKLVKLKIMKKISPPSVSLHELDSIGIIKM